MAEQQTQSKVEQVALRRSVTYRSYSEMIRFLCTEAERRIKQEKDRIAEPEPTGDAKKLGRIIHRLRTALKGAERRLAQEHKLRLYDAEDEGPIVFEWTYAEGNRLRSQRSPRLEARLAEIRRLKVAAVLDTIPMRPVDAKKYLLALEQKLAKI